MERFDRLPALPLVVNNPYFSLWLPGDKPNEAHTVHWSGADKRMIALVTVDGETFRLLGSGGHQKARVTGVEVTPTRTIFSYEAGSAALSMTFCTPALPYDLDMLSTPITMVDFEAWSLDGAEHQACVWMSVSDAICYDGAFRPEIYSDACMLEDLNVVYAGQTRQKLLCHSADHITIDWGYGYMASRDAVSKSGSAFVYERTLRAGKEKDRSFLLLGYDDVAAIMYFGTPCKAWYARNGKTLPQALVEYARGHDAILEKCKALDASVLQEARKTAGEAYAAIVSASWRHTLGAHQLICTPKGDMAFLSKENDSNGCIGTVDLSYPSSPLFLAFCPELVNAMCRPVLEFACMPVWPYDFAPHDVGRYPYANGQVYSSRHPLRSGEVVPPYYLYASGKNIYALENQMPVEECGNMLVMLYAAVHFGAGEELARKYRPVLDLWVKYLVEYGEDPGMQLCTDDFAGHLAHNVNLSAKAMVGVACCGKLLCRLGEEEKGQALLEKSREMARSWLARADQADGTSLTFDGKGWSQKYNLVWDKLLGLNLLPGSFYAKETKHYLGKMNRYGLPLDSRNTYTKSDWVCWCAAMAEDRETREALLAPLALYLRESGSRVAFSDWYDTQTGLFVEFIGRSVQGGVLMPLLCRRMESREK